MQDRLKRSSWLGAGPTWRLTTRSTPTRPMAVRVSANVRRIRFRCCRGEQLSEQEMAQLGSLAAALTFSPVILVTDRRVVSARRFCEPLSLDLERLEAIRVQQTPLDWERSAPRRLAAGSFIPIPICPCFVREAETKGDEREQSGQQEVRVYAGRCCSA